MRKSGQNLINIEVCTEYVVTNITEVKLYVIYTDQDWQQNRYLRVIFINLLREFCNLNNFIVLNDFSIFFIMFRSCFVRYACKNFKNHMKIEDNVTFRGIMRRYQRKYPRVSMVIRHGFIVSSLYMIGMSMIPGSSLPFQKSIKFYFFRMYLDWYSGWDWVQSCIIITCFHHNLEIIWSSWMS